MAPQTRGGTDPDRTAASEMLQRLKFSIDAADVVMIQGYVTIKEFMLLDDSDVATCIRWSVGSITVEGTAKCPPVTMSRRACESSSPYYKPTLE